MNISTVTQRTIFLILSGSHAYGLNTPESDEDYRGVCIPTKDYFFGTKRFEQQEYPGEDKVVYDIRKAFKLFADANPNMIELLFVSPDKWIIGDKYWKRIYDHRDLFLSAKVRHTYAGYAVSQLNRIKRHKRWLDMSITKPHREDFGLSKGKSDIPSDLVSAVIAASDYVRPEAKMLALKEKRYREAKNEWDNYQMWLKKRNPKRFELEKIFGYDCKHASHCVRLLVQGKELLETGTLTVDRSDIDADMLRDIKNGKWSYEKLLDYTEAIDHEFDNLYKNTPLPHKPDRNKIEELLLDIVELYIKDHGEI